MKTGVLLPIGLGNFIMATPALRHLESQLGRENLFLLALKPAIRDMGKSSGWFDRTFFWDPDKESIWTGVRMLRQLRKQNLESLLCFFPSSHWKFLVFAFLTGAKQRWGFHYGHGFLEKWVLTNPLPLKPSHDVEQNLELVSRFLGTSVGGSISLRYPPPLHHSAEGELKKAFYFVCHPGSSAERGMETKRLSPEKFARVIGKLNAIFDLKCVLIGGPEEESLRQMIALQVPESIVHYPTKNLSELGAVIHHSRFFLGNDSGLMHIAAALNKKCVIFFGPSDEGRSGPYSSNPSPEKKHLFMGTHLVLRNIEDSAPIPNPKQYRLKYQDMGGLDTLEIDSVWRQIEDYVRDEVF